MLDLNKYSETNKTITFTNGKTLKVYSIETKKGLRYYYYSMPNSIIRGVFIVDKETIKEL
jgi:hypothetical protein